MNVLFLGYAISKEEAEYNTAVSPVGNNMQLGMLTELRRMLMDDLEIHTFYPVRPFPRSMRLFIRSAEIHLDEETPTKLLPFINVAVLKHVCIMVSAMYRLLCHAIHYRKSPTIIITYHVSVFFTVPAIVVSKLFGTRIICLISDSPIDPIPRNNIILDFLRKMSNRMRLRLIRKYHGYLTINEYVIDSLKIDKPYIQVYVGADLTVSGKSIRVLDKSRPVKIAYTGALESHYLIEELIDAVKLLGPNFELNLYGKGTLVGVVLNQLAPNIKYHGVVPNEEIRKIQADSDILVCLLSKDSYLGKYAFPGKIFEYLHSGTPVISCNTPSIPQALRPFLNFVDIETKEGISMVIRGITRSEKEYDKAINKAQMGRNYVLERCNWKIQTQNIHSFLTKFVDY